MNIDGYLPVHIVGTSITYRILAEKCQLNDDGVADAYCPGKIIFHPSLGPLRCESIVLDDGVHIKEVECSIVHDRFSA